MLVPKRVNKAQKNAREAKGGKEVVFGTYGLQASESHWITNRQIEAARIAMTRYMKRGGKYGLKFSSQNHTQLKSGSYGRYKYLS